MSLAKYSGRFYNASNVTILFQDVLEARATVEIASDADLLCGQALGLDQHFDCDARRNRDHAVRVGEDKVARTHLDAFFRRAWDVDRHLPRGHLPAADRLHRRPVPGVNRKSLPLDPFDVADAAVDQRAGAAAALHAERDQLAEKAHALALARPHREVAFADAVHRFHLPRVAAARIALHFSPNRVGPAAHATRVRGARRELGRKSLVGEAEDV